MKIKTADIGTIKVSTKKLIKIERATIKGRVIQLFFKESELWLKVHHSVNIEKLKKKIFKKIQKREIG